jgi:hypothetical protein
MSAWLVSTAPKPTTSFLDIMSEELVTKLTTQDFPDAQSPNEQRLEEEQLAFNDYETEQELELDSDLALALALQEIEEMEHLNSLQQQQQQQSSDDYSKINISYSPGEHLFPARKASNMIADDDLDTCDGITTTADHRVMNGLRSFEQKRHQKGIVSSGRISAKDTKITAETVLDPTTRFILYKLIQNNKIDKLHGVIKTGKEANVYHGYRQLDSFDSSQNSNGHKDSLKFHWNKETTDFAVKIFKTTLNEFGNRQDYFHGDHRYAGQKFTKGGTKESIAKVRTLSALSSPLTFDLSLASGRRKSIVTYVAPMRQTFLSLALSITKRMSWYVSLSSLSASLTSSGDVFD